MAPLRERSARLTSWVQDLRAALGSGELGAPLEELALSYVHVHVNRILRSAQKAQELVLYDFLARLYESRIVLARKASTPTALNVGP